jgi:hypothetical protein
MVFDLGNSPLNLEYLSVPFIIQDLTPLLYMIESGQIIGIEENPGRSNQKMYILEIENYAFIVPFVEKDKEISLKTAFPSRKYTKRYGLKGE